VALWVPSVMATPRTGSSPRNRTRPADNRAQAGPLARPDGSPLRIAVVEDEPLISMGLETILAEHGAIVVSSTGLGSSALVDALEHRPDVVVMDIVLFGGLDGVEAARLVHDRVGTAVVFVSAWADDAATRARVAALKGPELLAKPVQPDQLIAAIRRACGIDA